MKFQLKKDLIFLIIFLVACKPNFQTTRDFSKENLELPTLAVIQTIVSNLEQKNKLQNMANQLGYSNVIDWYANVIQGISSEELDFYYNHHRLNFNQESPNFRKEIHERLAWKKMFIQAKIEYPVIFNEVSSSSFQNHLFLGSKTPKLLIVEFADFGCYYCAKFQNEKKKILTKYGNQIQWSFKNFPLVDRNEEAFLAHIALGCVEKVEPKKYWQYYYHLFENFRKLEKEKLLEYTKQLKIPLESWKSCMNDKVQKQEIISKIQKDINEGKKLGVTGTPSFLIGEKLYVGAIPYSTFEDLILRHLKK